MSRCGASLFVLGAFLALVSVSADAFAAHGLAAIAPAMEQAVAWFKEGANFQMNHALALMIAAAVADRMEKGRARFLVRAGAGLLAAGALLFPGALYSLSFAGPGFFAPWGGIAAMIGWILFAAGAVLEISRRARDASGRG